MADVIAVFMAFAVALGLLGLAVALWLLIDRLLMRRAAGVPGRQRAHGRADGTDL